MPRRFPIIFPPTLSIIIIINPSISGQENIRSSMLNVRSGEQVLARLDVRLQILTFKRSSFFTKKNGQRDHVDADVALLYYILLIICNNSSSFESKFFCRGFTWINADLFLKTKAEKMGLTPRLNKYKRNLTG